MSEHTRRSLEEIHQKAGPVANFIRHERKKLGYTQDEFALRVGVGIRFLKDIELGKKTARMDKVNQVLNFLGYELRPMPFEREEDN